MGKLVFNYGPAHVWLVEKGETGEGGHVIAACASRELALGVVWDFLTEHPADCMFYEPNLPPGKPEWDFSLSELEDMPVRWNQDGWENWHWRESHVTPDRWISGCDFVRIVEVSLLTAITEGKETLGGF